MHHNGGSLITMENKSPHQAIEDALARLGTATLFKDERTALQWVRTVATQLMRHKANLMKLEPEEREALDPIEARFIHASDIGTKPRKQRVVWMDELMKKVGNNFYCEVIPMPGTMSTWIVGRQTDQQMARYALSSLIPTCERLSQDMYYREYHAQRKAGNVEKAQGFKERWQKDFVSEVERSMEESIRDVEAELGPMREIDREARLDVARYMNENFLPTRGDRTERLATSRRESSSGTTSRHQKKL